MSTAVDVNLKQVFLPYYNILTGEHGWQFGLPPDRTASGLAGKLAAKADVSIIVLTDQGEVRKHTNQILALPHARKMRSGRQKTEPPRPAWGWVPFDLDGMIKYARVVAPKQVAGSVPLRTLEPRYVTELEGYYTGMFTKKGIQHFGITRMWPDIHDDLHLASDLIEEDYTEQQAQLGGIEMFTFMQKDGQILFVQPSAWALEQGLWSCHLYRIAKVFCTP